MKLHIEKESYEVLMDALEQTTKAYPNRFGIGYCIFQKFSPDLAIDFQIGATDNLKEPRSCLMDWDIKTLVACDEIVSSMENIYLHLWRNPKPDFEVTENARVDAKYFDYDYSLS